MKALALFVTGFFLGFALGSRYRSIEPCKLAIDVDEMASPSFFRRTVLLRLEPAMRRPA